MFLSCDLVGLDDPLKLEMIKILLATVRLTDVGNLTTDSGGGFRTSRTLLFVTRHPSEQTSSTIMWSRGGAAPGGNLSHCIYNSGVQKNEWCPCAAAVSRLI